MEWRFQPAKPVFKFIHYKKEDILVMPYKVTFSQRDHLNNIITHTFPGLFYQEDVKVEITPSFMQIYETSPNSDIAKLSVGIESGKNVFFISTEIPIQEPTSHRDFREYFFFDGKLQGYYREFLRDGHESNYLRDAQLSPDLATLCISYDELYKNLHPLIAIFETNKKVEAKKSLEACLESFSKIKSEVKAEIS